MTYKTLAVAACISLAAASTAAAATFNFSFDASTATSGDTSLMASGTLDINVSAGTAFTTADVSDLSIVVSSDLFNSFTIEATNLLSFSIVNGTVDAAGLTASFFEFNVHATQSLAQFGCDGSVCARGYVSAITPDGFKPTPLHPVFFIEAQFGTGADAMLSFQATTPAVPLPAGGLLLLSGLGGIAAFKRRKKRAA